MKSVPEAQPPAAGVRKRRRFPLLSVKVAVAVAAAVLVNDALSPSLRTFFVAPKVPSFVNAWTESAGIQRRLEELLQLQREGETATFDEKAETVTDELARSGITFVLMDRERSFVHTASDIEEIPSPGRVRLGLWDVMLGETSVGKAIAEPLPLWLDGELAGIGAIFRVVFIEGLPTNAPPTPPVAGAVTLDAAALPQRLHLRPGSRLAEYRAELAGEVQGLFDSASAGAHVGRGASALIVALLTGVIVAFVVTRRIRKLARQASVSTDGLVPGPFHDRGRDELGHLASVLSSMREQSISLIEGLRATDRTRREWIAQLSHDFRTPLAALEMSLARAERSIAREDLGAASRSLGLAVGDADRLRTLMDDMLELGRIELADELELEPVLPGELLDVAIGSVLPIALDRDVLIQSDDQGDGDELLADGARLLRALENLLANALRHCRTRVDVCLTTHGDSLRIAIHDDGPGFELAPDDEPVLLSDLLERRKEADGLGLLVAARVAAAHGGSILVSRNAAGGATVVLSIPIRPVGARS